MIVESPAPDHRYCRGCAYILDGLASARCPECGRVFDSDDPRTYATRPRRAAVTPATWRILLLAAACVPIELLCVSFVWYAAGDVACAPYLLLMLAGNLLVLVAAFLDRRVAVALLCLLVALTCLRPIQLRVRMAYLDAETARIIAYAEGVRASTGSYPANLAGYAFRWPWTASYIAYSPGFTLSWWGEQPGVSHTYRAGRGYFYYPD